MKPLPRVNYKDPMIWIATWFGCGLLRPAPGTWGTIGALPFAVLIFMVGGPPLLILAIVVLCMVGYWAAESFERQSGEHDNSAIVVDEVVGMWIAFLPTLLIPVHIVLAFILFRFFDIVKPWPVSWADKKLPGALGVMADDVIAGILAASVMGGLYFAGIIR